MDVFGNGNGCETRKGKPLGK